MTGDDVTAPAFQGTSSHAGSGEERNLGGRLVVDPTDGPTCIGDGPPHVSLPVSFHVNVHGQVQEDGDRYLLTSADNGQVFEILGNDVGRFVGNGPISVTGQVDADRIPSIEAGQPMPVVIVFAD